MAEAEERNRSINEWNVNEQKSIFLIPQYRVHCDITSIKSGDHD